MTMNFKTIPIQYIALSFFLILACYVSYSMISKESLLLGQTLHQGQKLVSKSGSYYFDVQSDGYLVIYRNGIQSIWMSPTPNVGIYNPKPFKCALESNGDLVFKDGSNNKVWSTGTAGKGAVSLTMEDNGNLALYDKDGNEVWSSGTGGFNHKKIRMKMGGNEAQVEDLYYSSKIDRLNAGEFFLQGGFLMSLNEKFKAAMQPDGNFVIYDKGNEASSAVWSTHTYSRGRAPYRLVMHSNGRLVVYDAREEALWTMKSTEKGGPGQYLVLENDGSLSVYDQRDKKLWSSYGFHYHGQTEL